jgi:DNA recombination protein RmuC
MDISLLILVIILGFVILAVFLNKKVKELASQKPSDELLEYLKTTNVRLDEQGRVFNERLDRAARVISEVQRNLGEMNEIGRGMKELQEFLRSPKIRGNIGEQILKEMLLQYLPKSSFNLQYAFKSGEKVDAAIVTSAGIIPIDSKFPMENFRQMISSNTESEKSVFRKNFVRDVKSHISDISQKYILTQEGTVDYALMYLPSEAVYYEVVSDPELFDFASDKRVLPVSPTTFYAFLRAILMSFEGQKIEKQAKELLLSLRAIQKDFVKTESSLKLLQKHLNNAYNIMSAVMENISNLGQKIYSVNRLENKSGDTPKLT